MPLSTSERMRGIRQAGTKPELSVRRILSGLGVRYRTGVRALPGSPDIANQSRKWAIFVHGCFWHGHEGCRLFTRPKTNSSFWAAKVTANRNRDAHKENALRSKGFRVATVWQCELDDPDLLAQRLAAFVLNAGQRTD
jgi:DNA mismatch endonuclease, patch repair protein